MEKRPFETRIDRDKRLGKMKREKVLCLINTILPTVAGVLFLIRSFVNSSPIFAVIGMMQFYIAYRAGRNYKRLKAELAEEMERGKER